MARNPGTRIGRPPKMPTMPKRMQGPTDRLDTAFPAKAFPRSQQMPRWHDDPKFCMGGGVGGTKRR